MFRFLVLSLATFLISDHVSASNCELPVAGPVQAVHFRENKNCELAKTLSQSLLELSQTLRAGPEISIVMGGRSTNASFDNGHILWIPQVLFSSNKRGEIQESTIDELNTVVLHEYGHAVFNEVLKAEFSNEFGAIFKEMGSISHEAEENIINRISSRGIRLRGSKLANSSEFMSYFLHIPAYSELYADTLTVLFMNDPSAMYKAMRFASYGDKSLHVELRDFTLQHKIEQIHKTNDAHTELSLVRSFIGEEIKGLDLRGRIDFLDKFERALVKAIKSNMMADEIPSADEKNRYLIELMRQSH